MTQRLLNRVRVSLSGTAGTGALTLAAAAIGFQTLPNGGMSDGDTTPYLIEDGNPQGSVWEYGVGTYHAGTNTFTRDTISKSSAGGTTPISVTSTAILNAVFRAEDIEGITALSQCSDVEIVSPTNGQLLGWNATDSKWEPTTPSAGGDTTLASLSDVVLGGLSDGQVLTYHAASSKWINQTPSGGGGVTTPSIVQIAHTQVAAGGGAASATFASNPTAGNLIIAFGSGGGYSVQSSYDPGWDPVGFDFEEVATTTIPYEAYQTYLAYRAVRAGDPKTWSLGAAGSASQPFVGGVIEIAGVDTKSIVPARITALNSSQSELTNTTAATALGCIANVGDLILAIICGGAAGGSMGSPTPTVNNSLSNNSSLSIGAYTASAPHGDVTFTPASASQYYFPRLLALSGV